MALISVILSLLIERYLGTLREFRTYRWFDTLTDRMRERIPEVSRRPLIGVILILALPVAGTLLVEQMVGGVGALPGFGFGLAVLLYSYGAQDLEPQIEAFIDARLRADDEAARFHLSAMLHGASPDDPRHLTRMVMEAVLVELNDRLLAVIFWFALLGPAGALGFRFSSLLKERFQDDATGFGAAANTVYHWLAWVPARLAAFTYALAGSFVEAMQYRRDEAHKWQDINRGVLVASGLGALQYPLGPDEAASREREIADLRATIELVRRTIVIWMGGLAVVVLVSAIVSLQLERIL